MEEAYSILVVDDNPDTRESAAMLLEAKGYAVRTAASGEEARRERAEAAPDLFLIDVHMPAMNGLELLEDIDVRTNDYEAVIITGHQSLADAQRAMELGARSYLTKPVRAEQLFEHVGKALGMLEMRRGDREKVSSLERKVSAREEELTLTQQVLEHKDMMINALFSSIGEGLMGVDTEGNVVLLNPAAERILGIGFAGCVGRTLSEVVDDVELRLQLLACLHGFGRGGGTVVRRRDGRGEERTYLVRVSQFRDRSGTPLGHVLNLVDQTEAVRAQEHRDSFLTLLAHELRTPVNIIANYASLLKNGGLGIPNALEIVHDVHVTSRRLRDLINGIIGLATITGASVRVERKETDVRHVVLFEVDRHKGEAEDRGVAIVVDEESLEGITAVTDPRILGAAVGSLIGNGVKSAGEGGALGIAGRLAQRDGAKLVELSFVDKGPGLPEEVRRGLRGSGMPSAVAYGTGKEGIGAGLFLVRRAMELLGGRLELREEKDGSCIVLTLPRRTPRRDEGAA